MSDPERGAYAPPHADAPLSFDPRQPERGARPLPLTLVLSVLVLAGLVAAIFWFYQSGVRQAGEAPPVVGTPVDGLKTAAPPSAQPQDPAAGLQVYQSDATAPLETLPEPKFAPPPEQPQPRPTTPVVVSQAPPVQPAPRPAAPSAATAQALKPAIPATSPPPTVPVQKAPATPTPKPAPPPEKKVAPPPAPTTSGGAMVQIGAVSSTALADKAWNEAVAAAPGLAAGKGKSIERIERNGGVLYRTAVTGFASRAEATAFCDRLKAAGKNCFVR
jgi:cytoskeletal protein RodZ